MRPGEQKSLGASVVARLLAEEGDPVRIEGRDRQGKPWLLLYSATGGLGFTTVWTADFDADGQTDFLIESMFPGNGACVNAATITLLLFDANGRPNPHPMETMMPEGEGSQEFPFKPVHAVDINRNGRAEFVLTDCSREAASSVRGVYEAGPAGGLTVVRNTNLAPYLKISGLPKAKAIAQWPEPVVQLLASQPAAVLTGLDSENLLCGSERCSNPAQEETILGDGRRIQGWPDTVVIDLPEGREIDMDGGWKGLQRVLREGLAVRADGKWMWASAESGKAPPRRADVAVELVVTSTRQVRAPAVRKDGECLQVLYAPRSYGDVTELESCISGSGKLTFRRVDGGTVEQLLPDRRTVRTAHTAMQHTVTNEVRYERPLEGVHLIGIAGCCDFMDLTQWTPKSGSDPVFALHDRNGGLLVSRVLAPPKLGLLITNGYALVFFRPETGAVVEVHGRLQWRRRN